VQVDRPLGEHGAPHGRKAEIGVVDADGVLQAISSAASSAVVNAAAYTSDDRLGNQTGPAPVRWIAMTSLVLAGRECLCRIPTDILGSKDVEDDLIAPLSANIEG
jgi:hypothetical protein